ncbi:UNVERIFIED_CONTAM: hypothetical protein FKN15_012280 [Acipenser sinensis]
MDCPLYPRSQPSRLCPICGGRHYVANCHILQEEEEEEKGIVEEAPQSPAPRRGKHERPEPKGEPVSRDRGRLPAVSTSSGGGRLPAVSTSTSRGRRSAVSTSTTREKLPAAPTFTRRLPAAPTTTTRGRLPATPTSTTRGTTKAAERRMGENSPATIGPTAATARVANPRPMTVTDCITKGRSGVPAAALLAGGSPPGFTSRGSALAVAFRGTAPALSRTTWGCLSRTT